MLLAYKLGQGSIVLRVKLRSSASATGAGLTGLTSASAGLIVATIADNEATTTRYRASSSEIETITALGTFAAPTSGKCRFKEVDATNHPGVYEIQIADARFGVASAKSLLVSLSGATNLVETDAAIALWSVDPYDAVRAGLTALPNAAAGANGGLPTGNASGQVALQDGGITAAKIAADAITDAKVASDVTIASVTGSVGSVTGNVGGNVTGSVGSVAGAVASVTGNVGGNVVGSIGSLATQAKADVNAEADTALADVGLTSTVTGRVDVAVSSRLATGTIASDVTAIKAKTDNLPSDPADASDVAGAFSTVNTTLGTIAGYIDTEVAAIKAKTDNLPASPAAASDIPTAAQNAAATAAAVTSDHGSGSYARNTEPDNASIGAIKTVTDALPTFVHTAGKLWVLDGNGNAVAPASATTTIQAKTDNLPSDPADQSLIVAATTALGNAIAALNNVSAADVLAQVNAALTETVADSIPADGSRPSIAQAAYMSTQFLLERVVSGTTVTVKKPDGSTLFTLTLNDADAPTSITRAA